jgi:nucleotide-binding universal stress UspA family protein
MLRQIAVPLDGSPFSATALGLARRLAERAGATLTLITVHEPSLGRVPAAEPVPVGPDELAVRTGQSEYLATVVADLGPMAGGAVEAELIDGQAGPALAEWIGRRRPDLVVMATHGRGPMSRFWLGSVADHLVRHASAPLLLVRPGSDDDEATVDPKLTHGLVAIDGSTEALAVLEPVGNVALASDARLTLLTVVEPILGGVEAAAPYPVPLSEGGVETLRSDAEAALERAAAVLRARGIPVDTRVVVRNGVATAILVEMDEMGVEFVALTHRTRGFERLVLGSVADKVVRGSSRPVLIARGDRVTGPEG